MIFCYLWKHKCVNDAYNYASMLSSIQLYKFGEIIFILVENNLSLQLSRNLTGFIKSRFVAQKEMSSISNPNVPIKATFLTKQQREELALARYEVHVIFSNL